MAKAIRELQEPATHTEVSYLLLRCSIFRRFVPIASLICGFFKNTFTKESAKVTRRPNNGMEKVDRWLERKAREAAKTCTSDVESPQYHWSWRLWHLDLMGTTSKQPHGTNKSNGYSSEAPQGSEITWPQRINPASQCLGNVTTLDLPGKDSVSSQNGSRSTQVATYNVRLLWKVASVAPSSVKIWVWHSLWQRWQASSCGCTLKTADCRNRQNEIGR